MLNLLRIMELQTKTWNQAALLIAHMDEEENMLQEEEETERGKRVGSGKCI